MADPTITLTRHTIEQQEKYPEASGAFTALLWNLTIAIKRISAVVNKAGLADVLGLTGTQNVHGETVQKLDEYANNTIVHAMNRGGHLCVMASEEEKEIIPVEPGSKKGNYILVFDPLDGSSNIDANVSVGTIFSILRRKSPEGEDGTLEDCLQPGCEQVGAGYVIYGSSTMLVYTTGRGVHGFTLDPAIGEFLLSHPNIRTPEAGSIYSVNEGNYEAWNYRTRQYIDDIKRTTAPNGKPYSLRYIGSLVADFHRNLLYGGIFLYPASPKHKLRLLYEVNPLAMIVEQAGGLATTGTEPVLNIKPTELHQRVPLIIGSKKDVENYIEALNPSYIEEIKRRIESKYENVTVHHKSEEDPGFSTKFPKELFVIKTPRELFCDVASEIEKIHQEICWPNDIFNVVFDWEYI